MMFHKIYTPLCTNVQCFVLLELVYLQSDVTIVRGQLFTCGPRYTGLQGIQSEMLLYNHRRKHF